MPLINKKRYLEIFTFPVKEYYRQVGFSFGKESFDTLAHEYIEYYQYNAKKSRLHKGVKKILQIFKNDKISQYILSAQKQSTLIEQVRQREILKYFKAIIGPNNIYAYDKTGIGLLFFQKMGINPLNTLLIGDTIHDWETARTLDCHCVLIANGHQSYARLKKTGAVVMKNLYDLLNISN